MNEVRPPQNIGVLSINSGSTTGTVTATSDANGKTLPVQSTSSSDPSVPLVSQDVESELQSVNDFLQSVQRDLQFSLDEESNRTVIRVVDSQSGDVIRQIPEDIFLELARRLNEDGEFNLLSTLG